jgi:hypothetical protein
MPSKSFRENKLAALAIALIFSFALFGLNLQSRYWIIDDHEIVKNLPVGEVNVDKLKALWNDTEVGRWGKVARFRPSYYFFYIFETITYGEIPGVWYFVRICMLIAFIYSILRFLSYYLRWLDSVIILTSVFAYHYWSDMLSRLGPGENYALLGCALYLLGFLSLWRNENQSRWSYLTLFVGYLIAAGAKENFLILVFPMVPLLIRRRRLGLPILPLNFVIFLSVAYTAWIAGSLLVYFQKTGVDFYAVSVTPKDRALKLISIFHSRIFLLLNAAFLLRILSARSYERFFFSTRQSIGFFIVLNALISSQFVFYNGEWPTGMRYDFPGQLILPILFAYGVIEIRHYLELSTNAQALTRVVNAFGLLVFLAILLPRASYHVGKAWDNRNRTRQFESKIGAIKQATSNDSKKYIILYAREPMDLEPVVSVRRFLRLHAVVNPQIVRYGISDELARQNSLNEQIARALKMMSLPEAEIAAKVKADGCYEVFFRRSPDRATTCSGSIVLEL